MKSPWYSLIKIATLALALLFFTRLETQAKKPVACKKVGYFSRRNPDKLVRELTRGITNDSLKVEAISCWITNYIRYDVKAFLNGTPIAQSTQKLLRRRKTTCLGYANLFKDLCQRAGIRAEVVTGYSKTHDVDINDSFFVGDHAWNAVYIRGRWYLFDLTWSSGHITYWRRTPFDQFVYYLTFLQVYEISNRPKFTVEPNRNFLFKTGDYFLYDHLPENPIWQLTDKTWSIEDFMNDSSYYYQKPRSNLDTYSLEFEGERQAYGIDGDTITSICDGYAYKAYNTLNELGRTSAINLRNCTFFKAADLRSEDTVEMLQLADSLALYAQKNSISLDTVKQLIQLEHSQKIRHLRIKNSILKQDVRTLNQSSEKLMRLCRKGVFFTRKFKRSNHTFIKAQKKAIKKTVLDKRYEKTKFKPPRDIKKSIYLNSMDSTQILIDSLEQELNRLKETMDSMIASIKNRLDLSNTFQIEKIYALNQLMLFRMQSFDDYDYPIRQIKDSLLSHNTRQDTLLFTGQHTVFDSVLYLQKRIFMEYKMLLKYKGRKLHLIRKHKSSVDFRSKQYIDSLYILELTNLQDHFMQFSIWSDLTLSQIENLKTACKKLGKLTRSTKKEVIREKKFIAKTKSIYKRTKLLKNNYFGLKYQNNVHLRRSKKIKSKYKKK